VSGAALPVALITFAYVPESVPVPSRSVRV
jgi:hypothetical protein